MSRYKFKGYTITNCGYHQPDHCVWWEAVNDNGEACFHGNTLREVEFRILDYEWEQKMKKKDEEIEKLKREKIEVEADALAVGGIIEAARTAEKSSAVGHAAAMREAMEKLDKLLFVGVDGYVHGQPDKTDEIERTIKSAISAPPRNCDVGTVEEQTKRYDAFCNAHFNDSKDGGDCHKCPLAERKTWSCQLAWSQMPYEAEEGGAK